MATTESNRPTASSTTQPEDERRLTLSQAARVAPGSPSPNCVWRWCRRGVLARSGERIRLRHVRIGGKLFTTRRWLDEFGDQLARADETYFDLSKPDEAEQPAEPVARRRRRSTNGRSGAKDRAQLRQIRADLDAEGL